MRELSERIRRREARCGVIGLGYVGLPLALEFARAGFHVTGIDVDGAKIDAINGGRSYVVDLEDSEITEQVDAGRLTATSDFAVIRSLDTINICVPTPLRKTKDPDLTFIVAAVEEIRKYLRRGERGTLGGTTKPRPPGGEGLPALRTTPPQAGRGHRLGVVP